MSRPIDLIESSVVEAFKATSAVQLRSSYILLTFRLTLFLSQGVFLLKAGLKNLFRKSSWSLFFVANVPVESFSAGMAPVDLIVLLKLFHFFSVESSRVLKLLVQGQERDDASLFILCFSIWHEVCSFRCLVFSEYLPFLLFLSHYCSYFFVQWNIVSPIQKDFHYLYMSCRCIFQGNFEALPILLYTPEWTIILSF